MLTKIANRQSPARHLSDWTATSRPAGLDRRTFLQRSGVAAGGLGLASLPFTAVQRKAAAQAAVASNIEVKTTVCTFCSVGCAIKAEVQDGVWIGQEPAFDSPINLGGHCSKGAAIRDEAIGERRLRYPM
jgi:formate dehydrogenase major subunit